MGRLFFADEYVQRPGDPNTAAQTPEMQSALKTGKGVLADLKLRIIEFFSEWLFFCARARCLSAGLRLEFFSKLASGPPDACQTRTRNQITPPLVHASKRLLV